MTILKLVFLKMFLSNFLATSTVLFVFYALYLMCKCPVRVLNGYSILRVQLVKDFKSISYLFEIHMKIALRAYFYVGISKTLKCVTQGWKA